MINTLLEHVPIKMEVKDVEEEEVTEIPASEATANGLEMARDDEHINETDEELEEDDEDDDDDEEDDEDEEEEDEEESETETDALEIEQEATMLISSDEEAELEAQRIRFPDKTAAKKLRRDSQKSSRSSSRNSLSSNTSSCKTSKSQQIHQVVAIKDTSEETDKKQRISPRLKRTENNTTAESLQKENQNNNSNINNNTNIPSNKKKTENNKNNRQPEPNKCLDNHKSHESHNKNLQNNRNIENLPAPNVPAVSKSRRGSNNSTCSVASTVSSDTGETESCGNIYVFNLQQKLVFNCEFCDLKYGDLENFGRHLHEAHKLFSFDEDPEKENAPRNVRKSNRQSNNAPKNAAANVKKEPLQCLDALAEPSPPPPVALPLSVLAEPLESCGNVFMLNHRKLFLVCGYCECKYANLDLFERHLRQQHRIFEGCRNEVNVVPKLEIKEEMFVISEVLGQQEMSAPRAMVSIPAEIPLNISISPENEAATLAALDETLEMDDELISELPTSSGCTKETVTSLLTTSAKDVVLATAVITNNDDGNSKENDNLLEAMDVEKPAAAKKTRNKRRSSPVKPLVSPNKRPKRNTRNTAKVQQEISPPVIEVNLLDKITTTTATTQSLETVESIKEIIKPAEIKTINLEDDTKVTTTEKKEPQEKSAIAETKLVALPETKDTKKSSKSAESKKTTTAESTETKKTIKSIELKTKTSTETTETKKITKRAAQLRKSISPETVEAKKTAKITEFKKSTSPEMPHTQKVTKSNETEETKDAKKIAKSAESKKVTTVATIETKEAKKRTKSVESNKSTTTPEKSEATATTKAVENSETIPSANVETKESRKSIKSVENKEPITSAETAETKVNRKSTKAQETHKSITQETVGAKEARKTAKTEAISPTETKESRKTTKEAQSNELAADSMENIDTKETTRAVETQEAIELTETPKSAKTEAFKGLDSKKKSRRSTKTSAANSKPLTQETAATKETRKTGKTSEPKKLTKQERPESADEPEPEPETSENEMQCDECDKKFARRESLKIHKRVHTGEKPFVCDICQKSFRAKQNLTMHKKFHMGDASRTFECEQCDKKFMRNTDLKVHMRTHTGEKKFKCGICLQGYASKLNVQTHIERDHLPADGVVGTPPRGKKKKGPNFKVLREELEYQKKIIEELQKAKKEKEVTNPTLSASPMAAIAEEHMAQMEQLPQESPHYAHIEDSEMQDLNADPVNDIIEQIQNEILLNEQERQQQNVQANSVTFTINTVPDGNEVLKLHNDASASTSIVLHEAKPNELLNSPEDIKPTLLQVVKRYVCDQCNRTFKKHIRLVEHQRVHTGEKPFACDECGKQFRIRMRLNEHKLRHSKDKKFKCEICGLGCCTKQDLNLHMRHHTNDRRFQCSMCPKAFVRSSDLKIHVRVHTGEKPFVCDICHKCFRANQNLSVHKKSHMGEASKTYQCEHCEKKFMRNIDRKVHMRSHTGEKPYKCEICQRGYSSKFNVRAHIERDHISANGVGTPPKGKKKPGPKPKGLKAELEKQKKLIEELQHQLLQQIKTDEKIIPSEEEILPHDTLQNCTITPSSPLDPIQSAYDLLNKLKSTTTTSKPLTIIPSPPPLAEPANNPFTKAKKASSATLLPLTITQKIEQHSPVPPSTPSSSTSVSCLSTPSPAKTTATKVVSQKTSLGIQQVSVTVSMQVENVTTANTPTTPEKENAGILTTSTSGPGATTTTATSVKKERKITSYFTVVGQKADV